MYFPDIEWLHQNIMALHALQQSTKSSDSWLNSFLSFSSVVYCQKVTRIYEPAHAVKAEYIKNYSSLCELSATEKLELEINNAMRAWFKVIYFISFAWKVNNFSCRNLITPQRWWCILGWVCGREKSMLPVSVNQSTWALKRNKLTNVYERILIHKWASLWGSIALKSSLCATLKKLCKHDGIGETRHSRTML